MYRFAKIILMASLVLGIFAFAAPDDAEAGWGCYGRSYVSSCYSGYRPYSYSYCAPTYRSCYYPSYNNCGYGGYNNCGYGYGYGGYGGGYSAPFSGYGGYGGYSVPTCYGQFNW